MIINFLESLIASYFFTNYFDLKINKYVYFIINFVLISSVINLFNYVKDYSIMLPLIVALIASTIAFFGTKNNYWEILFITLFDELIVGLSITISLLVDGLVYPFIRSLIAKILYFIIVFIVIKVCKEKEIKLESIYWKLFYY